MTQRDDIKLALDFSTEQKQLDKELGCPAFLTIVGKDDTIRDEGHLVEFESDHPQKAKGFFPGELHYDFAAAPGGNFYTRLRPVFDQAGKLISVLYESDSDAMLHLVVG